MMVRQAFEEANQLGLEIDPTSLGKEVQARLEKEAQELSDNQGRGSTEICRHLILLTREFHLPVSFFRIENRVYRYLQGPVRKLQERVSRGEEGFSLRLERALELGKLLGFEVEVSQLDQSLDLRLIAFFRLALKFSSEPQMKKKPGPLRGPGNQ